MQNGTASLAACTVCVALLFTACGKNNASPQPQNGNALDGNTHVDGNGDDGPKTGLIVSAANGSAVADGRSVLTVVATLTDDAGNVISGATVTFSGDPSHNRFTPFRGTTDANGVFSTAMISTVPGQQVVHAASGAMHGQGNITFGPTNACYGTLLLPRVPFPGIHDHTTAIVTGDFDLDGAVDLLLADSNTRTVYHYAGHGDGTFETGIATSIDPNGVDSHDYFVGDFNADGALDVVVSVETYGYMAIHFNDGHGAFSAPEVTSVPGLSGDVAAADVDSDGFVDFLAPVNGNVVVTLWSNKGALSAAATFIAPNVKSVAAVDIVGDGTQELVYLASDANVVVADGAGDGTFGLTAHTPVNPAATRLVVTNIVDDGDTDIVVTAEGENAFTEVYLGNGSGLFTAGATFAGTLVGQAVDMTGDGKIDLALQLNSTFQVFAGVRDGNFLPVGGTYDYAPAPVSNGFVPLAATATDVNGDKLADLLYATGTHGGTASNNSLVVALTQPDVGLSVSGKALLQYTSVAYPILSQRDLNGDGNSDLLVYAGLPGGGLGLTTFLWSGNGNFVSQGAANIPVSNPNGFVTGDFDHDGQRELAVVGDLNQVVFAKTDATGHFTFTSNANTAFRATGITVGDFNGDHLDDVTLAVPVASGSTRNNVVVMLSQNGNFPSAVTLNANASSSALSVADFSGDGFIDIAIADPQNQNILLFTGVGNGNFTGPKPVASSAGATPGLTVFYLRSSDLNNDGRTDLVTFGVPTGSGQSSSSLPTIAVWLNRGQGVFDVQPAFGYSSSAVMGKPWLADMDGDGRIDILLPDYANSAISVFFGDSDGDFQTQQVYGTDQGSPFAVVAGDYNQDGLMDIVSAAPRSVRLFLANTCNIAAPVSFERYGD